MRTSKYILLLLFFTGMAFAQNIKAWPYMPGVSVSVYNTGNGHGNFYTLNASAYNGRNFWSFGPCIQQRKCSLKGGRLFYSRLLTGLDNFSNEEYLEEDDRGPLQLNFFSFFQYVDQALLGIGAVEMEEKLNRNRPRIPIDYKNLRFSTAELCLGIGLNVKLGSGFVLGNYLGISTYYHFNYKRGLYEDKMAPALMLGTALHYTPVKRTKSFDW